MGEFDPKHYHSVNVVTIQYEIKISRYIINNR